MSTMVVRGTQGDGTAQVQVLLDGAPWRELFLETRDARSGAPGELLCCVGLPLAMKAGAALQVEGTVSPSFLHGLKANADIFSSWYPDMRCESIDVGVAEPAAAPGGGPTRTATFFSGGVDSFYTLLKRRDEIDVILLVRGFDIALGNDPLWNEVAAMTRRVADGLGKRLVVVHTNARAVFDAAGLWWGDQSHGAALAAVGHFIGEDLGTVYVPSTHTYRDLFPWGSHPLLDPNWSTPGLAFRHDGCEATRVDKVRSIAAHPIALSSLRVCYENRGGAYNCCRCEKCLRTMLNLAAVGALARAVTFPEPLEPRRVRAMSVRGENGLSFARENLEALATVPGTEALQQALRATARRARLRVGVVSALRPFPAAFRMARRVEAWWTH
jgi:hypothetical protein